MPTEKAAGLPPLLRVIDRLVHKVLTAFCGILLMLMVVFTVYSVACAITSKIRLCGAIS